MKNFEENYYSPFQPGYPVSPDNFKGRKKDINKIIRYIPRVIDLGMPEHYFITGKRGMGKTSFVKHVGHLAEDRYDMVYVYINNEGTNTISELIGNLLEVLLKEFSKKRWGQKIVENFSKHFQEIDIKGFGFKFKDKPEIVENIKKNFIEFLISICDDLEDKTGIFIVIDDVNGLSDTPEFVNWYKALFETIDFNDEYVPITFSLVTYPEKFDQLHSQNPSFTRMFNIIDIDKLDDKDIREFYMDIFNRYDIHFEKSELLESMIYYSWGMPLIMQQIGDSVFWNIEGKNISQESVYSGISDAANELRSKHLKRSLNRIKNPIFKNILLKIALFEKISFRKNELYEILNSNEKRVLNEFLDEMIMLNILEITDKNCEEFSFVNIIYFVYFLIMSNFNGDL